MGAQPTAAASAPTHGTAPKKRKLSSGGGSNLKVICQSFVLRIHTQTLIDRSLLRLILLIIYYYSDQRKSEDSLLKCFEMRRRNCLKPKDNCRMSQLFETWLG